MSKKATQKKPVAKKLGTLGLIALIIPAMIGGGAYDLPANMAIHAGLVGQILGWLISGLIIWFMVASFLKLSELRPKYTTGLYKYADAGFGKFTGFFVSWGYWICECFADITYAVLLASTLNGFFPGIFTGGNNINSIILGTVILWGMSALALHGIKGASWINNISTIVILVSLAAFIVIMIGYDVLHRGGQILTNPMANHTIRSLGDKSMGPMISQIKNTMMTSLWVFGGVEGAVVLSDRAKSQKNVRSATKWGFIICLVFYALMSILPLGFRSYGKIAKMASPSCGHILYMLIGTPGRLIIAFGVIIAVLASWLAWVILLSEMPRAAAQDGTFPQSFKKMNKKNMPSYSIIVSTIVMQVILLATHFAQGQAFDNLLTIVGTMTVPPYLISMMYLWKISSNSKRFNPEGHKLSFSRTNALIYSILATLGALYMGYAAGIKYTALSFVIYALGIPVYMWARTHLASGKKVSWKHVFTRNELIFVTGIILVALVSCIIMFAF